MVQISNLALTGHTTGNLIYFPRKTTLIKFAKGEQRRESCFVATNLRNFGASFWEREWGGDDPNSQGFYCTMLSLSQTTTHEEEEVATEREIETLKQKKKKIGRRRRRKSKSINHSNTGNYSCRISNFQPFILLLFSRSLSMFSENRPENYLIHSSTLIRYLLMLLWNLYISTYIWSRSIFRDHHDFRDWGELRERVLKLLQLQLLTSRKYQNKLLYQKLRSIWWKFRKNGEFACILLLLFFPSLQKIIPMNPYTCVCIYILEHVFIIV